jgi:hypothetical protein
VSAEDESGWRRPTLRQAVWAALGFGIAALMLVPYLPQLMRTPFGLGLGAAVAAYLPRRRVWDAVCLGAPVMAAEAVEMQLGPQFMLVLCLSTFVLCLRPRFSGACGGLLFGLLLLAIEGKQRFAGTLLTWQDLQFFFLRFADNVGVMASQPTLLLYAAVGCAAVGLAGCVCWRLDAGTGSAPRLRWRVMAFGISLALIGWTVADLRREAAVLGGQQVWMVAERSLQGSRPLSRFLATAMLSAQWTPRASDTSEFGARVAQIRNSSGGADRPADIVVFLQESQFNPATISGCPDALCHMQAFGATADTVTHGPLQVHVFGGGTWLTEFALANGVPHAAFGAAGDFAPFNVAPGTRRSFVRSLKAAGYRTVAVYPTRGGMMNGRIAYRSYGFDRFLDASDLGLSGSFATSDLAMHEAGRAVLAEERKHGQPVFLLVLTIFNHSEHGVHMDRVPRKLVEQVAPHFADERQAANVADYLWRTREFESVLGATRAAVLEAGRPAVFAWFGDHQPPFGNAISLRDRIEPVRTASGTVPAKFQTWYQVTSNVRHLAPQAELRPLDIVFLPGVLAQAAGVPLDDWLAANVIAREDCGGLLLSCRRVGGAETYLTYLWKDLHAFELP